jgi:O-antigen/teichoic acid export membrane protein
MPSERLWRTLLGTPRDVIANEVSMPGSISQIRNVLASWGAFALSAGAGLFLSPFVVHSLGATGFGVWVVIGSLTGTLNIFDLGMRSAVIRFVAREHARGDHDVASRLAATARVLFIAAGGLVVVVATVLAAGLGAWFTIPAEMLGVSRLVLAVSAASLAIVISNGLYGGIISGLQRLDVLGFTDFGVEVVRIVLVLVVLSLGGGLVGLALIQLLTTLLRRLIMQRTAARLYPELHLALRRPAREDVVSILSVSAYSTVIYTSVNAVSQASTIIIGAVLPLQMAAFYAIGATLPTYAAAMNRPIAQTVHPRASRLEALGDSAGLQSLILTTGRYSALLLLPMVLTFLVRGHTFVGIWMGPQFRGPAGDVLAVLGLGMIFAGTRHVMQAAFVGSGRHKPLGPWYVGEAVVIVLVTIFVVPRWGILGAAWATVVPGVVMASIVLPTLCRANFGVNPAAVWWEFWARPLLAMMPFAAVSAWLDQGTSPESYLAFFAQVFATLPVAAAGALVIGLDQDERTAVVERTRRMISRSAPERADKEEQ